MYVHIYVHTYLLYICLYVLMQQTVHGFEVSSVQLRAGHGRQESV